MAPLTLKFFKTHRDVSLPTFGTSGSACFDLAYSPQGKTECKGYRPTNQPISRLLNEKSQLTIMTGDRFLVPTGLIMDIPKGYSVRLHARSGLSLKQGLILANAEGVIDSDYFHECFIMLTNMSEVGQTISPGDRIAQGELVKSIAYELVETDVLPSQKTDRIGGYGSTGVGV